MTRRYIYNNVRAMLWSMAFCMMCCALCLALVACSSDDDAPNDNQGSKLHLVSCTRTVDENFSFLDGTKLWLALTSGSTKDSEGSYTYSNSTGEWAWTNGITVREAKQYYLYGLMLPTGSVSGDLSCSITSSDYSKGATLTVRGVTSLLEDSQVPCVVVGAKGVTNPTTTWDVTEGSFGYMGILKKGEDNAQLLLGRLYAGLTFSFTIDDDYSALRTIKLTSLKLKASASTNAKVDLTVVLEATTNGTSPIKSVSATATSTSTAAVEDVPLFNYSEGWDISTPLPNGASMGTACFASSIASNLSVECEYNVYDKAGNNLGERKAVNSLSNVISAGSLLQGQKRTINLNVVPTYLYILSDADLDNPVITVN